MPIVMVGGTKKVSLIFEGEGDETIENENKDSLKMTCREIYIHPISICNQRYTWYNNEWESSLCME